ncbi:Kae1-associated kinase Bud32 [Euryarchaeota archaeon ex4484_162]|nr:MAG: Kae1-associated kinase Bud32 [Euryarchaeota archaeon ex4484_162]RLF61840.1 MAG: Kae1-associated kinase Bud32 [Thermoplasmata archaeon]HDM25428.1 Kae1-associated serine/threonine protein kinase [Thermoplasmatales archaeon]
MAVKKKIIYRGAEAEILLSKYLNYKAIEKRRIEKKYRIKELDHKLRAIRTKEEAKLMIEARKNGVPVPIIYDVDLKNCTITMEYLQGKKLKDILNNVSEKERKKLCKMIGENIAKLHNNNIIHGDITTSNMILFNGKIHFIDFGLGELNSEIEAKGTDLHVLMEAFEATHFKHPKCFQYVLQGYQSKLKDDAKQVIKKIEEIVKRGRYR